MMIPLRIPPRSLHPIISISSTKRWYGRRGASVKEMRETGSVGVGESGRVGRRDTDIIHHVGRKSRNRKRGPGQHVGRERRRNYIRRGQSRIVRVVRVFVLPRRVGGIARERAGGRARREIGGGRIARHNGLVKCAGSNRGNARLGQS